MKSCSVDRPCCQKVVGLGSYRKPCSLQTASASIAPLYFRLTTHWPHLSFSSSDGASRKKRNPPPPFQPSASVAPLGSVPSTTVFIRGTIWVCACSPSSTITQRRPIL